MTNEISRKRRRSPDQIGELVSRYHQSKLTRSEFVRQEGICLVTFARYLKGQAALRDGGLEGFVEVDRPDAMLNHGRRDLYRICLPQGVDLEIPAGFSSREVSNLLEIIRGAGAR